MLDELNARLKQLGLWYPVDVSTSAQATIGGMTANNSCGARSLRYGNMVHNVLEVETWLTSGETLTFGAVDAGTPAGPPRHRELVAKVRELYARERDEIEERVPKLQRRVAGYNLDLASSGRVQSRAAARRLRRNARAISQDQAQAAPLPTHKTLGVVHFPTFYQAMDLHAAHRHARADRGRARRPDDDRAVARNRSLPRDDGPDDPRRLPTRSCSSSSPDDEREPQLAKLAALRELMGDLGLPGSVVEIADSSWQRDVWEVRKAGLNIMMSMKGDGKPVSFIEDCAVPLEHLAEYTDRLTRVFEKHGTRGTFYAHASVGCLHVRPVLNLRTEHGAHRCARSPRKPARSSRNTKARTPASTATVSCGRSGSSPYTARAWRARSSRSRRRSTRGA